jgi:hypothetical protein
MMSGWTRIGDNDVASFGKQTFRFEAAEGYYFVVADEADQAFVQVSHHDNLYRWPIYLKFRQADCFKLCGMTHPMPRLLSDVYWYEFVLGPTTTITYWGDRVVFRSDRGIRVH